MARKRHSQLRDSILYTSLFTIIGILAVLMPFTYTFAAGLLERNARSYAEHLLRQVNDSIDYYINGMTAVSDYITDDPTVIAYLDTNEPGAAYNLGQSLKVIAGTRPDFVNLIVFRLDTSFVASRDNVGLNPFWDYRSSVWYQATLAAAGKPVLSSSRVENLVAGEYKWVVTLSRALYVNGQLSGMLLIDLNYKSIADICSSLTYVKNGYIYIIGADNRLVYHPQQRLIYSGLRQERLDLATRSETMQTVVSDGRIYSSILSGASDWVIVSVFDTRKLVTVSVGTVALYVGVALFFMLAAMIVASVSARRMTDPILALQTSMQQFEQGDFDAKAHLTVNNEISELGESFNVMTERIKKLVENSLLIEEQKRKSEIQALQSQIRPHFLYNTLESIIWMASAGEQEQVVEMTASLARLMRASTSKASELVTVQTEIDIVANYLKIQKMRYQDKLDYRINVEAAVQSAMVLRLIVQPLVENAIYHGIKPLRGAGLIIINVLEDDGCLMIRIADNGVGLETAAASPSVQDDHEGIGISNVDSRIKLFFGADYGLTLCSLGPDDAAVWGFAPADGLHTIAALTLPLIFE